MWNNRHGAARRDASGGLRRVGSVTRITWRGEPTTLSGSGALWTAASGSSMPGAYAGCTTSACAQRAYLGMPQPKGFAPCRCRNASGFRSTRTVLSLSSGRTLVSAGSGRAILLAATARSQRTARAGQPMSWRIRCSWGQFLRGYSWTTYAEIGHAVTHDTWSSSQLARTSFGARRLQRSRIGRRIASEATCLRETISSLTLGWADGSASSASRCTVPNATADSASNPPAPVTHPFHVAPSGAYRRVRA